MESFSKLELPDGNFIAYHQTHGKKKTLPGIIFLGGFRSDMTGTKAMALDQYAKEHDLDFIRMDYMGHGSSSGSFEKDGTISRWKENALSALDNLTEGPQILVGSSMGGWLALLVALERKERIAGLLGLAAAPDFTENLIWNQLSKKEQQEIIEKGLITINSNDGEKANASDCIDYPITKHLIEDGMKNMLLHDRIDINCPVRLIHGMKDTDVPYQTSVRIAELLTTYDVKVILQKSGNHRLSEKDDLELLEQTLSKMLCL